MNNIARIQAAYITRKVEESQSAWLDVIAEEKAKIKGYCVDQNNNNQKNIIENIIAPGENIDNDQVISDETGEVLRDLI